jgi:hypothetical protein
LSSGAALWHSAHWAVKNVLPALASAANTGAVAAPSIANKATEYRYFITPPPEETRGVMSLQFEHAREDKFCSDPERTMTGSGMSSSL